MPHPNDEREPVDFGHIDPDTARERELERMQPGSTVKEPVPFSVLVGRVVIGAVVLVFAIFALLNLQRVDFKYVFGESLVVKQGDEVIGGGVPLILLLLGAFLLGMLAGSFLNWRRRRRESARAAARAVTARREG